MKELLKDKKNIIFLILISAIVSVPLMTDYVLVGDSTAASIAHIENVYQSIGKVFPIRLGTIGMEPYGYSMAAFQADVFYLIPAFIRLIGISLGNSFKLTLLLFNIATAVIAFNCFAEIFNDKAVGMAATMLYVWCPYRITSMYTSGNLSEVFAWTFVPLIILGLCRLYLYAGQKTERKPWICLSAGFVFITLSSTVFMFIMAVLTIVFALVIMRKKNRYIICGQLAKTAAVTIGATFWYLIPMILRMRDPYAVGSMLPANAQEKGMYLTQYLKVFGFAGTETNLWQNGMTNAVAYEPGAAVAALILLLIGMLFTGVIKNRNNEDYRLTVIFLGMAGGAMLISLNAFPWDMLQNKNMLFSIILALMENPARWGTAADVCLIITACFTLKIIRDLYGEKVQLWALMAVACVSFGTTQFLLCNILSTEPFAKSEEIAAFGNIEIPVIYGESAVWRLCEAVSAVFVCAFAVCLVRRMKCRKEVKK